MSNPWFRLYAEFANDPKVQLLSEQDQRRLIMIFCMRCNGDVTLQDKHVTFQLRITPQDWAITKALFIESGFIDSDNNVLNWDKRQYISDSSASRVARHRALHKTVTVTPCNVTVTPPEQIQNRTDTEQINTSMSLPATQKADPVQYEEIVNLYHQTLPMCPKVVMLTTKRKGQIAARWKSGVLPDLETWKNYFEFVSKSDFLTGKTDPINGHKRFVASLEWLTNESNFVKTWENKYHGK